MSIFKMFFLVFSHHSDKPFSIRFKFFLKACELFNTSFPSEQRKYMRFRLTSSRSCGWSARRDYLNYLLYNINSGVY